MNDIPKCKDCGQNMLEVGEIKNSVETVSYNGKDYVGGITKLYQCPEDKTVAIEPVLAEIE